MTDPLPLIPDFYNLKREDAILIFVTQAMLARNLEFVKQKMAPQLNHVEIAILEDTIVRMGNIARFLSTKYNITREEYMNCVEKLMRESTTQREIINYEREKSEKENHRSVPGYA